MPAVFSLRVEVGLCIEILFLLGPWISWSVMRACFMGVISYNTLEWSWHLHPDRPTVMIKTWPWNSEMGELGWCFHPHGQRLVPHRLCWNGKVAGPSAWRPGGRSSLWLSLFIFQGDNDTYLAQGLGRGRSRASMNGCAQPTSEVATASHMIKCLHGITVGWHWQKTQWNRIRIPGRGTSLVGQWVRICLPMQRMWV